MSIYGLALYAYINIIDCWFIEDYTIACFCVHDIMHQPVKEIIDLKYEKSEWEDWEVIVFSHVKIEARNKSDSFYSE